jgi:nitroreductase
MKNRRSIRKYSKDPISLEKICQILEAGRYSPSGANIQPWIYVIVTDKKLKEEIREEAEKVERNFHENAPESLKKWMKGQNITAEKSFLTEAPVLVVVAGLTTAPYWLESTWIAIAYILLSVENQKLGTLTYTPTDKAFLNKLLNIPKEYHPVAILPIGKPAENPDPKTRARKNLKQIVYLQKYGNRITSLFSASHTKNSVNQQQKTSL